MSTETVDVTPPKKQSLLLRVLIGVCGVIAIVGGIVKINRGIDEFFGDGPQIKTLLAECDVSVAEANKANQDAAAALNSIMESIDAKGLEVVRQQQAAEVNKAIDLYAASGSAFRKASEKVDEALKLNVNEPAKSALNLKMTAYRHFADSCDRNQEELRAVFDDSLKTVDDFVAKIKPIVERRKTALEAAVAADKEADRVGNATTEQPATEKSPAEKPTVESLKPAA